jgi:hypothetical protein
MLATTHPDVAALVCPSLHLRWKEGEENFVYFSNGTPLKPHFLNPLFTAKLKRRVTSAAMSGES